MKVYPMGQTVAEFGAKQLAGLLRTGRILNEFEKAEALNCLDCLSQLNGNGARGICIICKMQDKTEPALPLTKFCHAHMRAIIDASARSESPRCSCGLCISVGNGRISVWEGRCYKHLEETLG